MEDKIVLCAIRDAISDFDEDQRKDIHSIAYLLREIVKKEGANGAMAFALVGAEMAAGVFQC